MVYFISGHRDLTLEEFEKYYVPKLQRIFEDDSNIKYEFNCIYFNLCLDSIFSYLGLST